VAAVVFRTFAEFLRDLYPAQRIMVEFFH
jgi:hypothetical protein